jgi:hypothetical protein
MVVVAVVVTPRKDLRCPLLDKGTRDVRPAERVDHDLAVEEVGDRMRRRAAEDVSIQIAGDQQYDCTFHENGCSGPSATLGTVAYDSPLAGHQYYVTVQARNTSGLRRSNGTSAAILAGTSSYAIYMPNTRR